LSALSINFAESSSGVVCKPSILFVEGAMLRQQLLQICKSPWLFDILVRLFGFAVYEALIVWNKFNSRIL